MRATVSAVALFAVMATGCAPRFQHLELYMFRGLNVTVVHTCTDVAMVYQGQKLLAKVSGVAPIEVPLVPRYGGDRASLVVQSLDDSRRVVATAVQDFNLNGYEREREVTWIISDDWNTAARVRYRSGCGRF